MPIYCGGGCARNLQQAPPVSGRFAMTVSIDCVVPSRSRLGEGAIWDVDDARLWWVDIRAGLVHCYDPASGTNDSVEVGEQVGSIARRTSGGLVMATESGFTCSIRPAARNSASRRRNHISRATGSMTALPTRMAVSGREASVMTVRRRNAAVPSTGLILITVSAVIWTLSTRPTAWLLAGRGRDVFRRHQPGSADSLGL